MRPRAPFYVRGGRGDLDLAWVTAQLKAAYWGHWYTDATINEAVNCSMCFGAYETESRRQIGFCRVITDRAILSSLTDMVVESEWRRKGVGTSLLRAVVQNPWVAETICILASRDARPFYARHGFVEVGGDVMKRSPR